MLEELEKCLQYEGIRKSDIVQIRSQHRLMTVCTIKNGVIEEFSNIALSGIGVRALVDGKSWGFSSTSKLDINAIQQTVKNSMKLAKASSKTRKKPIAIEPAKAFTAEACSTARKKPRESSAEDVLKIPMDAYKGTKEAGQLIVDSKATYISLEDEKYLVSNEGVRTHQNTTRVMLFVDVLARRSGKICPSSENVGQAGGLEVFDRIQPYSTGKAVAEKAVKLLNAKAPPSGLFEVIIHPTLCATLLHEAIGHPLEADLAMSGGGFGSQVGKTVSSKLVTIYDDGTVKGGLGYFPYDDEGVRCKHNILIEKGNLRSFMHDRTSAALARASPTGNAHAWDYSVEPLIRQTNIGIEPGDFSLEEMVRGVREGFFLEGTFGGQADSNADFTFGFQSAKRISRGELGEELRGANVAGNAIEVFKTIDAVGKEAILRPGACGKYQFAVQGRVVPAIRCRIMIGGAGDQ